MSVIFGAINGIGTNARFKSPQGVASSPDETFALVSDRATNKVRKITISTGMVTTFAGPTQVWSME